LSIFVQKLSNFTSFSEWFYFKLISDPDPAKSLGYERIRIHNTEEIEEEYRPVGFPSADSHTEPNYDKLGLFRRLALHGVLYLLNGGCLLSAVTIMTKKIRRFYNYPPLVLDDNDPVGTARNSAALQKIRNILLGGGPGQATQPHAVFARITSATTETIW
jgi:hypothetical protein